MDPKVIGVVAHTGKKGAAELVRQILGDLADFKLEAVLDTATAELVGLGNGIPVGDMASKCDLVMVVGGDGSLLRVAHQLGSEVCPLMGLNHGSLGFLTCVSSKDHRHAVESIAAGRVQLSRRSVLQVEHLSMEGEVISQSLALNDCVVSRGELSRLVRLEVRIDGDVLTTYNADGLIIATSTGSTAYSMSAGGPIITPGSGVFVVTPICPHVLTNRSVIVPDRSLIEVFVRNEQRGLFLTTDGQQQAAISAGEMVRIKAAPHRLPLALLPDMSFYDVLRQKLRWTGSNL